MSNFSDLINEEREDRINLDQIKREFEIKKARELTREILTSMNLNKMYGFQNYTNLLGFSQITSTRQSFINKKQKDNMEAFTVLFDSKEQGILYQEIAEEYGFKDHLVSKTTRVIDYSYLHFSKYNGIKGTGRTLENHLDNPSYSDFVKALKGEYQWEELYYLIDINNEKYQVKIDSDNMVTIGCRQYEFNWLIDKINQLFRINGFEYIEIDSVGITRHQLKDLLEYLQNHE